MDRTLLAWSGNGESDFMVRIAGCQYHRITAARRLPIKSEGRHQRRYERRKAKREVHKMQITAELSTDVFSYTHLMEAGHQCCNGVNWKHSTQLFKANFMLNIYHLYKSVENGTFKTKGFVEFDLVERGKKRHIKSIHITERTVQKCLCTNYLVPHLERGMIYDNGASVKGKGTAFTLDRLVCHLNRYYRKHGSNGYIVLFDFHDYFNSLRHDHIFEIYDQYLPDGMAKMMAKQFVRDNGGDIGLGLGSQVYQMTAVCYCNVIDHYFKDQLRVKGYGRYMDDGYIIAETLEEANSYVMDLVDLSSGIGLSMNPKKLHIQRIDRQFEFLKTRILMLPSGHVLRRITRRNVTAERRKLKRISAGVADGRFDKQMLERSLASWLGYAKHFEAKRTINEMTKLYKKLK